MEDLGALCSSTVADWRSIVCILPRFPWNIGWYQEHLFFSGEILQHDLCFSFYTIPFLEGQGLPQAAG